MLYTLSPSGPYVAGRTHVITATPTSGPTPPCTLRFTVQPCTITCKEVVKALDKEITGCNGVNVDASELWEGPSSVDVPITASQTYGPGKYLVDIKPNSPSTVTPCIASVTVLPCKPACVTGTTVAVPLDTCEISDAPAGLLDPSTVSSLVPGSPTTSPVPPFRVGPRSAVVTLTYPGGVIATSDKCAFTVRDTQRPQVAATPRCIQPKNGVNSFGAPSYCFSSVQLANGTDNCRTVRYTVGSCRNLRPLLTIGKPNPCFFGPTLACIDIGKSFPAPAHITKPRTMQLIRTASDSSSNTVSVTSYIDIYFQPKDGCVLV